MLKCNSLTKSFDKKLFSEFVLMLGDSYFCIRKYFCEFAFFEIVKIAETSKNGVYIFFEKFGIFGSQQKKV